MSTLTLVPFRHLYIQEHTLWGIERFRKGSIGDDALPSMLRNVLRPFKFLKLPPFEGGGRVQGKGSDVRRPSWVYL